MLWPPEQQNESILLSNSSSTHPPDQYTGTTYGAIQVSMLTTPGPISWDSLGLGVYKESVHEMMVYKSLLGQRNYKC